MEEWLLAMGEWLPEKNSKGLGSLKTDTRTRYQIFRYDMSRIQIHSAMGMGLPIFPSPSPFISPPFSSFPLPPSSRWNNAEPSPEPDPDRTNNSNINHPAFKQVKPRSLPPVSDPHGDGDGDGEEAIRVTDKGVTYKLKDAPFEFQYSYTETPKVKPVALREPPFLPFGPKETPRPWTGRAPLPPSKKKLPEFDSFNPPRGKKGVKPVQVPCCFQGGDLGGTFDKRGNRGVTFFVCI